MFCDVNSFHYEPIKKFIRLLTSIVYWTKSCNVLINTIYQLKDTVWIVHYTIVCHYFLHSINHLKYSGCCIETIYDVRNKGDPYKDQL